MKRFTNKNVFLTGAASGIGKATARRLANEGAKLIIADVNQKLLDETSRELKDSVLGTYTLDISNVNDVAKIFEEVRSRFKTLQALVNVAGILRFDHSKDVELKDWQNILDVNLTGTFFMCRYALPLIIESNGSIVNVSSTAALGSHAWTAAYSASKGGISAFSKTLAVEYGVRGVNVNCVCPASIETNMSTQTPLPSNIDKRLLKKIMPVDGVNRTPQDIASAIVFLASEDAVHINGIDLRVDGGLLT
ncbi:MAG: SDR family oxidoreductase [Gammaproteobacteria bacterium TMED104]|nr:MAG: SDR family oxidoreductase [Gammaproteobacteria bacterium TMED104]|tara:strand:- start:9508 stop:10254 length:747 start_codon:yes stop_codon:yes gene_type:complete